MTSRTSGPHAVSTSLNRHCNPESQRIFDRIDGCLDLGFYAEALELCFRIGPEDEPGYIQARIQAMKLLDFFDRVEEAVAVADGLVRCFPYSMQVREAASVMFHLAGKPGEALRWTNAIVYWNGHPSQLWARYAWAYFLTGRGKMLSLALLNLSWALRDGIGESTYPGLLCDRDLWPLWEYLNGLEMNTQDADHLGHPTWFILGTTGCSLEDPPAVDSIHLRNSDPEELPPMDFDPRTGRYTPSVGGSPDERARATAFRRRLLAVARRHGRTALKAFRRARTHLAGLQLDLAARRCRAGDTFGAFHHVGFGLSEFPDRIDCYLCHPDLVPLRGVLAEMKTGLGVDPQLCLNLQILRDALSCGYADFIPPVPDIVPEELHGFRFVRYHAALEAQARGELDGAFQIAEGLAEEGCRWPAVVLQRAQLCAMTGREPEALQILLDAPEACRWASSFEPLRARCASGCGPEPGDVSCPAFYGQPDLHQISRRLDDPPAL